MTDETTGPRTAAGRRLFTDVDPLDMLESNGVTWDDILAIEAEAAAPRDALRAAALGVLGQYFDGAHEGCQLDVCYVAELRRALTDSRPTPEGQSNEREADVEAMADDVDAGPAPDAS